MSATHSRKTEQWGWGYSEGQVGSSVIVDREGPKQQKGSFRLGMGQYSRDCVLLCQGGPGPERNKAATVGLPNSPSAWGEKGHGAEAGIQAINPLFKE